MTDSCFGKSFDDISEHETSLLNQFRDQIGGEKNASWIFPSFAVMIPSVLYAHTDSRNPTLRDITVQVNVSLKKDDLEESLWKSALDVLGENLQSIPFSIVFYQRQCIQRYSARQLKIAEFPRIGSTICSGRKRLSELLSLPGSNYDYRQRFFNKQSYIENISNLTNEHTTFTEIRTFSSDECIDRGVSSCDYLSFL